MRMLLGLGLLAVVVGAAAGDDKHPLNGKWVIESLTRDGANQDASYKGAIRVNDGDKYTVTPPATSSQSAAGGTFTLDATKKPGTIDMKPGSGRYKDKTLQGIYKVEGDTLTIAFAEPGKDRPTAFESKPGSGVVVAVHKKAK